MAAEHPPPRAAPPLMAVSAHGGRPLRVLGASVSSFKVSGFPNLKVDLPPSAPGLHRASQSWLYFREL